MLEKIKLFTKADAAFSRTLYYFAVVAAINMAVIIVAVTLEVVLRYFFDIYLVWIIEITEWSLLWITFLAAAWVLEKEGHVIMEIVLTRFSTRTQLIINTVTSIIGVIICFVVTWFGAKVTIDLFKSGTFLAPSTLEPPAYIIYTVIPVGSFLLAIQFIRRACLYIRQRFESKNGKDSNIKINAGY